MLRRHCHSLAAGTRASFTPSLVFNLSYKVGGSNRTYVLRLLGLNELLRVKCVTEQCFAQRKRYIGFAIIIILKIKLDCRIISKILNPLGPSKLVLPSPRDRAQVCLCVCKQGCRPWEGAMMYSRPS